MMCINYQSHEQQQIHFAWVHPVGSVRHGHESSPHSADRSQAANTNLAVDEGF